MDKLKFAYIGCGRISYKHVADLVNNLIPVSYVEVELRSFNNTMTEK